MQLHQIVPKIKPKKKRYIGHGGKKGTYAGRGIKGQRSRTGARIRPQIRDLIKKIPKIRGYDMVALRAKPEVVVINLKTLEKKFENGSVINKENLIKAGILKTKKQAVKILSDGDLTKSFKVESLPASKKAIEKILKAGGNYV